MPEEIEKKLESEIDALLDILVLKELKERRKNTRLCKQK